MRRCSICGGRLRYSFEKYGYAIWRCLGCGGWATQLNEPYEHMVRRYYNRGYFKGNRRRTAYADYEGDREIDEKNFKYYLDTAIGRDVNRGKLLDVGCATGTFLSLAQTAGFTVFGNDVSKFAAAKAKKQFGVAVRQGNFTRMHYPAEFFSVISLFDVIEHLDNPRRAFKKIHRLLTKRGYVVLTTGDSSSFLARLLGKQWFFFIPPQHLWVFSRHNLVRLLQDTGFKVKTLVPVGRWFSLRHGLHLLRTVYPISLFNWLYRVLGTTPLTKLSVYVNVGSTILVVAQK